MNSRQKGSAGEREAAKKIEGQRTWQHLHDVFGLGRWWEVKRTKTGYTQVYAALEEHAEHTRLSGDGGVPGVLIRQDRKPWVVVFYLEDWMENRADADLIPDLG